MTLHDEYSSKIMWNHLAFFFLTETSFSWPKTKCSFKETVTNYRPIILKLAESKKRRNNKSKGQRSLKRAYLGLQIGRCLLRCRSKNLSSRISGFKDGRGADFKKSDFDIFSIT